MLNLKPFDTLISVYSAASFLAAVLCFYAGYYLEAIPFLFMSIGFAWFVYFLIRRFKASSAESNVLIFPAMYRTILGRMHHPQQYVHSPDKLHLFR